MVALLHRKYEVDTQDELTIRQASELSEMLSRILTECLIKGQIATCSNIHSSNALDDPSEVRAPNAHQTESAPALDPDLALIVSFWPSLPAVVRAGILAMVRACEPTDAGSNPTNGEARTQ
jgi:hypothetical protein